MKVLFISDFSLNHTIGGAQRSNDIIIKEGLNRGHEVSLFTYDKEVTEFLSKDYDIVVSSNLEVISKQKPEVLDYLASIDNHSRLEHDMCYYLTAEKRKRLYENCNHSFFLTQYHCDKFKEYYGDYFNNVRIVPDPISKDFYDFGKKRDNKVLYVGFFHPLKGTTAFCQYVMDNPQTNFVVSGWGDSFYTSFFTKQENVEFFASHNHGMMPVFYNSCDTLYCRPVVDEPFCRSFGEALCCGIKNFITNEKIGSYHMYEDLDSISLFRQQCYQAHETFWEILEK